MIVADTNVIAYLLIRGERTREAEMAYERDPDWAAPLLWRSEFRNVVALHRRRGELSADDLLEIMATAESLMSGKELTVGSAHVLALAFGSRCSAYDCEFVALARELGVPLVTADRLVLSEFPTTAVALERFIA